MSLLQVCKAITIMGDHDRDQNPGHVSAKYQGLRLVY